MGPTDGAFFMGRSVVSNEQFYSVLPFDVLHILLCLVSCPGGRSWAVLSSGAQSPFAVKFHAKPMGLSLWGTLFDLHLLRHPFPLKIEVIIKIGPLGPS